MVHCYDIISTTVTSLVTHTATHSSGVFRLGCCQILLLSGYDQKTSNLISNCIDFRPYCTYYMSDASFTLSFLHIYKWRRFVFLLSEVWVRQAINHRHLWHWCFDLGMVNTLCQRITSLKNERWGCDGRVHQGKVPGCWFVSIMTHH